MNVRTISGAAFAAIFISALFFGLFAPTRSSALSCMMPQYPEIAQRGAIVVGTITNVEYSASLGGLQTNRVTVSVERGWGNAAQTMVFMNPLHRLWSGTAEGRDPIPFAKGNRYLIVLSYDQAGQWSASLGDCSSSFIITADDQLQNFINARVSDGMGSGTVFAPLPCNSDDCGTPTPGTYCPALSTTFVRGARDATTRPTGQVTELQRFLSDYYDIDPSELVTGFFGRITHSYVVKFQQEQNLPAFGIVGSMTRAAIARVCGGGTVTPPPSAPFTVKVTGGTSYVKGSKLPISWGGVSNADSGLRVALFLERISDPSATYELRGGLSAAGTFGYEIPRADQACHSAMLFCPDDLKTGTYKVKAVLYRPGILANNYVCIDSCPTSIPVGSILSTAYSEKFEIQNDWIACPAIAYSRPICSANETAAPVNPTSVCPGPWRCVPIGTGSPSISSFSGPTTLTVGQTGTWSIAARDSSNGTLSYSIDWGEVQYAFGNASASAADSFVQNTSFTHSYTRAGTYTVTITVRNAAGISAQAKTTVVVTGGVAGCTTEYNPVCGQPPFRCTTAPDLVCTQVMPAPKTYSNMCALNADGATFINYGACNTVY